MNFLKTLCLCLWVWGCGHEQTVAARSGVKITKLPGRLRVEIGGQLFTEYYFQDVPRPFCYPVVGPGEQVMTRHWPMKTVGEEDEDHPHHRSLWFAHGNVNGVDFWSEQKDFGKQLHEKFLEVKSGSVGIIKSQNRWVSSAGKIICRDVRTLRFFAATQPEKKGQGNEKRAEARIMDFTITLQASEGPVTLGDTKEGTMAIRIAETMRLTPNKFNRGKPSGHIVLSTGVRDAETWGKRAAWCDYYGQVAGQLLGVAMFDHPQNLRHPTWWHVRDYGLFAANPFGVCDFEKKPPGTGNFTLLSNQNATFRYRFVFHAGDEQQARIAALYQEYADGN